MLLLSPNAPIINFSRKDLPVEPRPTQKKIRCNGYPLQAVGERFHEVGLYLLFVGGKSRLDEFALGVWVVVPVRLRWSQRSGAKADAVLERYQSQVALWDRLHA